MLTGEKGYMQILEQLSQKIEERGFTVADRTGVGTQKIFGAQVRFDLSKEFPLFTHKQVFLRGIFEELMWFLRGETNIRTLVLKDVNIWNEWRYKDFKNSLEDIGVSFVPSQEEFIDRIKVDKKFAERWGNIGKGYGHQWRRFGEVVNYRDHNIADAFRPRNDVIVKGFDQINWVLKELKVNPDSRRLIVSGWNPHEVDNVDLPPCHTLFQFFVEDLTYSERLDLLYEYDKDFGVVRTQQCLTKEEWLDIMDKTGIPTKRLSSQLYQRSADVLLGVPFNIASYALMTHIFALECGYAVGEFIWTAGDVHVYSNQYEGLKEILENRSVMEAPKIKIKKRDSVFDYEWGDVELIGYQHQGKVKMPVAV